MRLLTEKEHLDLVEAARERDRLRALLNTPELVNFRDGVLLEALRQRERWGSNHDAGKTPADWHWLVAHLAGRALFHATELERMEKVTAMRLGVPDLIQRHREKAVHHCVTTAAAIANWHAAMLGLTNMRPGIEPPLEVMLEPAAGGEA